MFNMSVMMGVAVAGGGGGPVPDLQSVSASNQTNPNCSGQDWVTRISWTTDTSNDSEYQIDIDYCTAQSCTPTTSLITGLTTASSSQDEATGVTGEFGGLSNPVTHYRTYRVKVVRKSDSNVMEQMDTSEVSTTVGDCI